MTEEVLFCREMLPRENELRRLRADLRSAAPTWQLDGRQVDLLLVLATELVTMVIEHAGTPSVVLVSRRGQSIRVTVDDHSLLPLPNDLHLHLVALAASDWNWTTHETGKSVWAEIDTST